MSSYVPQLRTSPLAWLGDALAALDRAELLRVLRTVDSGADPWITLGEGDDARRVLHLCSNGYLGLATDPRVVQGAVAAARSFGAGTGSARLITGAQTIHRALESQLAEWKRTEDTLLFSSGYLANVGVISALVGRGDTVVSDALNHASIIDGCRLSGAQVRVYEHGDADHAERLLADAPGRRLLATDGVFSMDGDLAPLPALCDAAERHGAMVVVDDAHGSGVVGPDGRGTVAALGCEGRVHAVVATLSKALGSQGGYVAGSSELVAWLRNRARGFVFDTALAPPSVGAAAVAVAVARAEPWRREQAVAGAASLAAALRANGWEVPASEAAIVPIQVGEAGDALALMRRLLDEDVLAVAIRPPTVPVGSSRVRATVLATHTEADVARAVAAFGQAPEVTA
ncbi:MAG: 8-amino-7-oxononanoate synthase [Myxococcota bacterium]|jgi:8-amino-7-oxononanoate synthase